MLLAVNDRFVESHLVGLNHELMSELRWREYPTDLRATSFARFWPRPDGADDIPPIHTWGATMLGDHATLGGEALVVLLVRGDVVRRYPDLVVGAVRARAEQPEPDPAATPAPPVFALTIDPATTAYAFRIDPNELVAPWSAQQPGWFFVLREHGYRIRFGFDVPRGAAVGKWSDLAWPPDAPVPGGPPAAPVRDGFAYAGVADPPPPPGGATERWGANAADMAVIALQRPFQVAIHAHRLLGTS